MMVELLKSKIHKARITDAKLDYSGSLSIDKDLMKEALILPYEKIDVYNITNGKRFTTYAIPDKKGVICANGAAARLVYKGDEIIIVSYCLKEIGQAESHKPIIILVNSQNEILEKIK